ncbi:MAG: hypothetical protein IPL46_04360 [Saprospiraceae bacterium]|nr:hypothetical protein [Saprospiraceae bacterium]
MLGKLFLLGIFTILISPGLFTQTCCSGGVPLSSNIGLPMTLKKSFLVNLNYDANILKTLKQGSETIDDPSRIRRTHSLLLQFGYTISDFWSIEFLFSGVQQQRIIQQFGNTDRTTTNGLGDAVVLTKFKLISDQQNTRYFNAGLGFKAPTGPSDLNRRDGLPINADLQPGSGAWDLIIWGQAYRSQIFRPGIDLSLTGLWIIKGKNRQYLGSEVYQFGNDLQFILGIADRLFSKDLIFDPSLSFRFRKAWQDQFNASALPGTGGHWIFVNPGITFWVSPSMGLNTNIEIPALSHVIGTQLSTSYRLQVGVSFKPKPRNSDEPDRLFLF